MAAISSALISMHLGAEMVVQGGGLFLSFLELFVADRGTVRDTTNLLLALLNPRFSAFQAYHVASTSSARQDALNECLKPFELRQPPAQSVLSSSRKQYL